MIEFIFFLSFKWKKKKREKQEVENLNWNKSHLGAAEWFSPEKRDLKAKMPAAVYPGESLFACERPRTRRDYIILSPRRGSVVAMKVTEKREKSITDHNATIA